MWILFFQSCYTNLYFQYSLKVYDSQKINLLWTELNWKKPNIINVSKNEIKWLIPNLTTKHHPWWDFQGGPVWKPPALPRSPWPLTLKSRPFPLALPVCVRGRENYALWSKAKLSELIYFTRNRLLLEKIKSIFTREQIRNCNEEL